MIVWGRVDEKGGEVGGLLRCSPPIVLFGGLGVCISACQLTYRLPPLLGEEMETCRVSMKSVYSPCMSAACGFVVIAGWGGAPGFPEGTMFLLRAALLISTSSRKEMWLYKLLFW